jgi:hypothetical protein
MKKQIDGLIFKLRKSTIKRRSSRSNFFKKRANVARPKFKKPSFRLNKFLLYPLFLIVIIVSILGFTTLLYRYVSSLRNIVVENKQETVFGFDFPSYPNSEYIFQSVTDNEEVKNFVSLGNSVYRLPKGVSISSVFTYYNEKLPTLGWTHTLSVPVDSESMLFGEYWVKESKGLRIYSRLNDVWYQSITIAQAQKGLEDVVKKESARKLLLLTTEKTDLLPDFPWRLSFPTEYSTNYFSTSIGSLQGVSFKKIGSQKSIYIHPVGYLGGNSYDAYLDSYVLEYNKKNKTKWVVINSVESNLFGNNVVKGIITNGKDSGTVVIINNIANNVVYAISTFEENDPFANYIYEKIKPSILNQ